MKENSKGNLQYIFLYTHPVEQHFPQIDKTLHTNIKMKNIVDVSVKD